VLRDAGAAATAKASAARTLAEFFMGDDPGANDTRSPLAELSIEDIDREIARVKPVD
jgi:hypothetical protein